MSDFGLYRVIHDTMVSEGWMDAMSTLSFFKGILFCLSSSIFEMETEFYDLYFFPIRFPGIASVLFPLLLLLFHKTCMFV